MWKHCFAGGLLSAVLSLPAQAQDISSQIAMSGNPGLPVIAGILATMVFVFIVRLLMSGDSASQVRRIKGISVSLLVGMIVIPLTRGDFGHLGSTDSNGPTHKVVMSGEGFSVETSAELKPQALKAEQIKAAGQSTLFESEESKRIKRDLANMTRMYQARDFSGEYGVSISDIPSYLPVVGDVLKNGTDNMIKGMNATETANHRLKKGNYEGIHVEGNMAWPPNHAFAVRAFYAGDRRRLYQCLVVGRKDWVTSPNRVRFLESFDIIPLKTPKGAK